MEDGVAEEEDAFLEEEHCQRREVNICAIKGVTGGRHTVECKGDKKYVRNTLWSGPQTK